MIPPRVTRPHLLLYTRAHQITAIIQNTAVKQTNLSLPNPREPVGSFTCPQHLHHPATADQLHVSLHTSCDANAPPSCSLTDGNASNSSCYQSPGVRVFVLFWVQTAVLIWLAV